MMRDSRSIKPGLASNVLPLTAYTLVVSIASLLPAFRQNFFAVSDSLFPQCALHIVLLSLRPYRRFHPAKTPPAPPLGFCDSPTSITSGRSYRRNS